MYFWILFLIYHAPTVLVSNEACCSFPKRTKNKNKNRRGENRVVTHPNHNTGEDHEWYFLRLHAPRLGLLRNCPSWKHRSRGCRVPALGSLVKNSIQSSAQDIGTIPRNPFVAVSALGADRCRTFLCYG